MCYTYRGTEINLLNNKSDFLIIDKKGRFNNSLSPLAMNLIIQR